MFFKFINKYQKEILRCAPPSSHVCDFSVSHSLLFFVPLHPTKTLMHQCSLKNYSILRPSTFTHSNASILSSFNLLHQSLFAIFIKLKNLSLKPIISVRIFRNNKITSKTLCVQSKWNSKGNKITVWKLIFLWVEFSSEFMKQQWQSIALDHK